MQDFKLEGAHLKKLRRAEGGANIFGVFRVKNHDFTSKNLIFFNFRGGGAGRVRPPPLDPPLRTVRTVPKSNKDRQNRYPSIHRHGRSALEATCLTFQTASITFDDNIYALLHL
jgi:hypothetical protein